MCFLLDKIKSSYRKIRKPKVWYGNDIFSYSSLYIITNHDKYFDRKIIHHLQPNNYVYVDVDTKNNDICYVWRVRITQIACDENNFISLEGYCEDIFGNVENKYYAGPIKNNDKIVFNENNIVKIMLPPVEMNNQNLLQFINEKNS